jgi:nucleoside-diphosphate-sugar epimerase
MKIIVTGALGHIGSYLVRELVKHFPTCQIVMIDNMMTQRFASLFNLPKIGKYKFIEGDIIKIDLINLLDKDDIVIHLAAITDAAGSFERAEELENNNFLATKKIAEACLSSGAKLISLSSTSIYGTQNKLVTENCDLDDLKPQSPYATTKLKEENYVMNLAKNFGLKSIILRFGTIFGTSIGMRFHTAVNKFCWQAVMNEPITVWSTAFDQKRPYLDLKDATNAFIHIIENDLFNSEIYNILTLNCTVRQITDEISNLIPSLKIKFVDNKIMNQLSYEVSNQKFINTGFTFQGDLKSSLYDTVNLLKNSNNQ